MRTHILTFTLLAAVSASAQARKDVKEQDLKKASSATPDASLAGDITRQKVDVAEAAPALKYDQFRLSVELQVADKRRSQIENLQKIIQLTPDDSPEKPDLLFRMGELYFEESKHFFYEANRKDDDYIRAMNAGDKAGQERAKADKEELLKKSKEFATLATDSYADIVQRFKDFKRTDEVLYFLGHNLMEQGDERKALAAYGRLIKQFAKPPNVSKYLPDAYLAYAEYYFLNSKGKRDQLLQALKYYQLAEQFPENQAYAFSIYKQGWCYFNLGDYEKAMDKFKAVVLYGQFAGAQAVEKDGGKGGRNTLIREARADYVKAFARSERAARNARADFGSVTGEDEEQWAMLRSLANLYYGDGKDREAALTYNTLIQLRPRSPEAPGFQGRIVDCVLRAGNKKMTVDQVRRLVTIHDDVVKSGAIKSDKDKKALEEARDLSERTLSNLAVNWHNEAKKTRDDDTFGYANEVYGDYLALFSDNKKAYDLRFFWSELLNDNLQRYDRSAEQYTLVFAQDIALIEKGEKPGKWMKNAAYNAVLAWDEVVKQAEQKGTLKNPDVSDPAKKAEIAPLRKSLLDASERYLKYVTDGDKQVEIAFKVANIYYRHNHFDEAVPRFAAIAEKHAAYKFENGEKAGELAANLILDTYNLQNDWAKVNEWARRFYADSKLAQGDFKAQLAQVVEQSAFKLVNQMEANKEYAKAAEAYLAFVSEFPRSEIAEKALFNASIDFYQAKMLDRAIETRKRIISQYPKSEFVPACIYANAEALEAIGDFAEAADHYEQYVRGFESSNAKKAPVKRSSARGRRGKAAAPPPSGKEQVWEESKAQIALFNAGVFRDGLGQYRSALKNRERYLELWPSSPDAEAVFLSITSLHEKAGAWTRAMKHLEEYERKYIRDPNKVLMAEGRIAQIYAEKLRKPRDARRIHGRIWSYYEKLNSAQKRRLDNAALDAVARAHYELSDEDWRAFTSLKLRWGQGRYMADHFKKSLQDKVKAMGAVQKRYTQTVQFKSGDPAICALYKIGEALHHMADAVENAPMPKGAPEELQMAIQDELASQALPIKEQAAEAYAVTVQKGQELDIFNDCFQKSLARLRDGYRPYQFPAMREDRLELTQAAERVLGGDILAAIQPIPVMTQAEAQAARANAEGLKDELSDLKNLPSGPDASPRVQPASGGRPGAPSGGGLPNRDLDEEPEDLL